MIRRTKKDLRRSAFHEAGHVVIGRVLTLDCGDASIVPDYEDGCAGYSITFDPCACIYAWERRGKVRGEDAVWHARIMTYMAGAEAESVLLGLAPQGDGHDLRDIELMAEELQGSAENWSRIEMRLRSLTRMLVQRHRARIERVAAALLKQKTLSREQLNRLVNRSVDDVKVNAPFLLRRA
jgi:ATP-dependent Zn protease